MRQVIHVQRAAAGAEQLLLDRLDGRIVVGGGGRRPGPPGSGGVAQRSRAASSPRTVRRARRPCAAAPAAAPASTRTAGGTPSVSGHQSTCAKRRAGAPGSRARSGARERNAVPSLRPPRRADGRAARPHRDQAAEGEDEPAAPDPPDQRIDREPVDRLLGAVHRPGEDDVQVLAQVAADRRPRCYGSNVGRPNRLHRECWRFSEVSSPSSRPSRATRTVAAVTNRLSALYCEMPTWVSV